MEAEEMGAEEMGEEFPGDAGEHGTPARRWRSVLVRILVGGFLALAVGAGVLRWSGLVAMRLEARRMEERFGSAAHGGREPLPGDANVFHSLLELKRGGTFHPWPEDDGPGDPALAAATEAYARVVETDSLSPRQALESAVAEALHRPSPAPEAWTLLETWISHWEPGLRLLDAGTADARSIATKASTCLDERELDTVASWLGAIAVLEAHRGDSARALARLGQVFRLARASGAEPPVAFTSRALRTLDALAALQQVLRLLPRETDLAAFEHEVESLDAVAGFRSTVLAEWRETYALYVAEDWSDLLLRPVLLGMCLPEPEVDLPPAELRAPRILLWKLVVGHDAARYTHRCRELLDDLGSTPAQALEAFERRRPGVTWLAPTADWQASLAGAGVHPCIDLESALRLARIGLLDRASGREAALELAARTLDPATGEPIQQREEDDGSLTLWCVGSDRVDRDGEPEQDDVVWVLPASR